MLGGTGTLMNPWGPASSFGKAATRQANVTKMFQASENKAVVSSMLKRVSSDPGVRASVSKMTNFIQSANTKTVAPAGRGLLSAGKAGTRAFSQNFGKKVFSVGRKMLGGGLFVAGAAAMAGIAFMNGGMSQAQDIMYERYMRDARYSSRLLSNSNVGVASGNSTLNTGNHVGLSLALNKRRHG